MKSRDLLVLVKLIWIAKDKFQKYTLKPEIILFFFPAASREIKQDLEKAREEIDQLKSERYNRQ